MKITLSQLNPTVGDLSGNLSKIFRALEREAHHSSDLAIFPELFLCGYPPRDLLERKAFLQETNAAIEKIKTFSRHFPDTGILFGAPVATGKDFGKGLFNSAILIQNGNIVAQINKSLLPTYDVFDEARYFDPAEEIITVPFKNEILGISVCEDAWNDPEMWYRRIYTIDPISVLARKGATLFINISASPFNVGKDEIRFRLIKNHVIRHHRPFVFVNQVGGNDELIFDGTSFILNGSGEMVEKLPSFQTAVKTVDLKQTEVPKQFRPMDTIASIHQALVLGLKDYVTKCGFSGVLLGLSGGIDSAVTCALAVAALGADSVWGVTMPSIYSSTGSVEDSRQLAQNLGVKFDVIPIKSVFDAYISALEDQFAEASPDSTEENIQARIRGNYLMALSNKFAHLVLSTGNKSETAMGYCTLYGDMSGGLSVINDVPKTMVYRLAEYINRDAEIIPRAILEKAPSAELRPDQTDQDTLPPYDILDAILDDYLENGLSASEIIKKGFDENIVYFVIRTIDRNEYKRRQAAPGLKVTSKAFGSGRRIPIAAKFDQSWG